MQRVTGLGGVFLKARDPQALASWYKKYLDISFSGMEGGGTAYAGFKWVNHNNPDVPGNTAFSFFKEDTGYFKPSEKSFMINFRVKDLTWLLDTLKKEGITVVGEMEEYEYGKFGWIMDPEGNKVELWEPVD